MDFEYLLNIAKKLNISLPEYEQMVNILKSDVTNGSNLTDAEKKKLSELIKNNGYNLKTRNQITEDAIRKIAIHLYNLKQ